MLTAPAARIAQLEFNRSFLADLSAEVNNTEGRDPQLGQLFVDFGPYLKMYSGAAVPVCILALLPESNQRTLRFRSFRGQT